MNKLQLLLFCGLFSLGLAWKQQGGASSCYVRQSVCSDDSGYKEDIKKIRETLENTLGSISASLQQIAAQNVGCGTTDLPTTITSPTSTTTTDPSTDPSISPPTTTDPSTSTDPSISPPTTTDPSTSTDPSISPPTTTDPSTSTDPSNSPPTTTDPSTSTDPSISPPTTTDPSTSTDPSSTTILPTPIGTSCQDLPPGSPSGVYQIQTNSSNSPVQVYCDTNQRNCSCDSNGGWTRVANLDMTDPSQECPDEFREVTQSTVPLRTCGRIPETSVCVSAIFPTYNIEYSHVCGKIIGYQYAGTLGFQEYSTDRSRTIDDLYVHGVSLTHGQSPRQHIWTFANALQEVGDTPQHSDGGISSCPCIGQTFTGVVPPFIGQDYFCDTGSGQTQEAFTFYPDDPLWDGQGCGGASTCCEFNNPPWFCKQLPEATTDDIELRLCGYFAVNAADTRLESAEIYIQ